MRASLHGKKHESKLISFVICPSFSGAKLTSAEPFGCWRASRSENFRAFIAAALCLVAFAFCFAGYKFLLSNESVLQIFNVLEERLGRPLSIQLDACKSWV